LCTSFSLGVLTCFVYRETRKLSVCLCAFFVRLQSRYIRELTTTIRPGSPAESTLLYQISSIYQMKIEPRFDSIYQSPVLCAGACDCALMMRTCCELSMDDSTSLRPVGWLVQRFFFFCKVWQLCSAQPNVSINLYKERRHVLNNLVVSTSMGALLEFLLDRSDYHAHAALNPLTRSSLGALLGSS
jgi:hypothetical protein